MGGQLDGTRGADVMHNDGSGIRITKQIWRQRPSRPLLVASLWAALSLQPAEAQDQPQPPSWWDHPESVYPHHEYLTGVGLGTHGDAAERSRSAELDAQNSLVQSMRTRIAAEFILEKIETSQHLDASAQSRIVSSTALEVDGIKIARQAEVGGRWYALAVLDREGGRSRHAAKIASLDAEITQGVERAQEYEAAGDTQSALQAYLSLYRLLTRREEARAVFLALGDFTSAAFGSMGSLAASASLTYVDLQAALRRLTQHGADTVDEAAAALALQLAWQLPAGQQVLVLPFTYGKTDFISSFSQYFVHMVNQRLVLEGSPQARRTRAFVPVTADMHLELGRQSGAEVVVSGTYLKRGDQLKICALATKVASGERIGAAEVEIAQQVLENEGLAFEPPNIVDVSEDLQVFADQELAPSSLRIEVWTNFGADNLVLAEGEVVTLSVRANRPCYVQILDHLASGERTMLYQNLRIAADQVNEVVGIPRMFVVAPPLGVEVVQVFASTERFPYAPVVEQEGYFVLQEDLPQFVRRTRGLRRQTTARLLAEARLTVNTVPRH